jgi:hypothetical protein
MGIPDGAHTHGSGGPGPVLLVLLAAAALGTAVAAAVAAIVHALIIATVVILGLAAVGRVALAAWRLRQPRPGSARMVHRITPAPWRPVQAPTELRQAIGPAREIHLHLHDVSPEDVAAVLRDLAAVNLDGYPHVTSAWPGQDT